MRFGFASGLAMGADGCLYISDGGGNHCIRHLSAEGGVVSTVAGDPELELDEDGEEDDEAVPERGVADGVGCDARFSGTSGVRADPRGGARLVVRP